MPESSGADGVEQEFKLPPQIVRPQDSTSTITIPDVFHLGIHFEYLRDIVDTKNKKNPQKRHVLQVLENINTNLADQNTRVSKLVSKQQRKIGEPSEPEERISSNQAEELKKQVTSWIHLFSRDLANETRIPAVGSGVLDIDVLIEHPSELFSQDVWNWLDQQPKADIEEACRSVAVGCATASVMLSLRAVEHCLREWYEQENESLEAAWGRVLDQLMEEYAEEDKRNDTVLTQLSDLPPVLTNLYYLKEKRNEVSHPEESPSPREAQRTLLIVSSTITEIYEEIRDKAVDEALHEYQGGLSAFDDTSYAIDESDLSEIQEEVLEIIRKMDEENEYEGVEKEIAINAAMDLGLSEMEAQEVFQDLLMDGNIYEPDANTIKPI